MKSRKIYTKLFVLMMLLVSSGFTLHKYYMSITQIDYNKTASSLEVTIKLFTDDLEQAIEATSTEKVRLGTDKESIKANALINKYLNKHFSVKVNGQPVTYKFVGKEVNIEVVWVYLEVVNIKGVSSVTVNNTMLTEIIEEQKNVVKLNINDVYDSHVFTASDKEKQFSF